MMLYILAVGDYYAPADDTTAVTDLKDETKLYCRERFRRIERFTQLCLIGSGRCVQNIDLAPNTGLYIGSRFASISNTNNVHTQMIKHGQIPKPAHFINTLSNSAGYYVGRNLALKGKNLFISRADASTEAVFQMAQLDLKSQQADQIVVGIADEMPHPLSDHRQRLGVNPETPLAEASHWFLVAGARPEKESLAIIVDVRTLSDKHELRTWLSDITERHSGEHFVHYSSASSQKINEKAKSSMTAIELNEQFALLQPYLQTTGTDMRYSPALTAGVISHFIQHQKTSAILATVHHDEDNRFHVTLVKKSTGE